LVPPQQHAKRCIADRAGHDDQVARFCGRTPHHFAVRHRAEGCDRDRRRAERAVGVAAEQRTAISLRVLTKAAGKSREPRFIDCRRQCERQQKAERGCAFGGEIGQIHPQRLAADIFRQVVWENMHANNNAVGGQHDVASGRRRNDGGVVDQAEGAGMLGQRPEIARDQAILGRFWRVWHRAMHRLSV
jgi:hypothetical protein